ncbi:MAG: hypothetical protein LBV30_00365 [Propionibacteriaceae bacterium]|jgi:hypothetical protein|nr:hypothetical protein [Propionibacteriaceae bacterium]
MKYMMDSIEQVLGGVAAGAHPFESLPDPPDPAITIRQIRADPSPIQSTHLLIGPPIGNQTKEST